MAVALVEIILAAELHQLREQQTQAVAVAVSTITIHQAQAVQAL